MRPQLQISIYEKYALTIEEAADYFGIGQSKLRRLLTLHKGADFILLNGTKILIKRQKFEEFLNNTERI